MGRPPKPVEKKRQLGNPGKRPLPSEATVVALPMAPGVPEPPADLGLEGRQLWARVWAEGLTWISPLTDMSSAIEACELEDDVAAARKRYRVTTDPKDGRILVALSKRKSEALSGIGFDPTARSRLGVAEVRKLNALEELITKRRA